MLPRNFKDDEKYKDLVTDVYPIMKMILQFNSQRYQHDYSYRNILTQKMSQIVSQKMMMSKSKRQAK